MHTKIYKQKYERKLNKMDQVVKKNFDIKWIIRITIIGFLITLFFSFGSEIVMKNVNSLFGIIIIFFFIFFGALFDMIGIAVTCADQKPFHSMASKKIKGAKTAVRLIKKAEKVSAFCNDVIGDICNIMSGSAGIVIATNLAQRYNADFILITLGITAVIASSTIGLKALGKSLAINKSEIIVFKFAKLLSIFKLK